MNISLQTLITGAFARVPGRQVLEVLPRGAPLQLVPEPDNPYDASAIKVLAEASAVPQGLRRELADRLEGTGFTVEELADLGPIHVGYVAATNGKPLQKAGLTVGNQEFAVAACEAELDVPWPAELCFSPSGEPMCRLTVSAQSADDGGE